VKGTFTPRHRPDETGERAVASESVDNYYPAINKPAQFARVQARIETRKKRGKGPKIKGCTNLFSGLLRDARDGQRFYIRRSRNVALIDGKYPIPETRLDILEFCNRSWRKLFLSPEGVDIGQAYEREADINITVPTGNGWESYT
jgi:hypothetical protein